VTKAWIQTVPILDNFAQLAETTGFAPAQFNPAITRQLTWPVLAL
jgi:hypothetical protein